MRMDLTKTLAVLALPTALSACGLTDTQSIYEEIRAQQNAKSVGSGRAPVNTLPTYEQYKKKSAQASRPNRPNPPLDHP